MVCSYMLRFPNRLLILAAFVLASGSGQCIWRRAPSQAADTPHAKRSIMRSQDGYVGTAAAPAAIAASPAPLPKPAWAIRSPPSRRSFCSTRLSRRRRPPSLFDAKSNHRFDVNAENGKLIQSEYETGANGQEVFRSTS